MESSGSFDRGPSKPLTRTFTNVGLPDAMDPEVVPSSLSEIAAILRVANEVEHKYGEPRVAYLCRFYAFEKAHNADPNSTGRGVRQFKTALLSKLERDVETSKTTNTSDARVMRSFYERFYKTYIKSLESKSENVDRAQLARTYRTANILFEVWKAVSQSDADEAAPAPELVKESATLAEREKIYGAYNILPLDPDSSSQAIMRLPEECARPVVRTCNGNFQTEQ